MFYSQHDKEVAALALTQMGFCFLGTLINNTMFSTLRDMPGSRASTLNVLLGNLFFCNMLICTLVKPISSIYVSYSYAVGSKTIGLAFCSMYTLLSRGTMSVLPCSLVAMSWHIFMGTRRAADRASGIPKHVTNIFTSMVPLARAIVDDPNDPPGAFDEITGKMTPEAKRRKKKAHLLDDGPRAKQTGVVVAIWVLAGCFGMARYMQEQAMEKPKFVRTLTVKPMENSSHEVNITRDMDIAMCTVWQSEHDTADLISGLLMVLVPLAVGPVLASLAEFVCLVGRWVSGPQPIPSRCCQWTLVILLSLVTLACHTTHLYAAEVFIPPEYGDFVILMTKYSVGDMHLLLTPIFVILCDTELRRGVSLVYYRKRLLKRDNTDISSCY